VGRGSSASSPGQARRVRGAGAGAGAERDDPASWLSVAVSALAKNSSKNAGSPSRSLVTTMNGITASPGPERNDQPAPMT